jgi:hypothetical protein
MDAGYVSGPNLAHSQKFQIDLIGPLPTVVLSPDIQKSRNFTKHRQDESLVVGTSYRPSPKLWNRPTPVNRRKEFTDFCPAAHFLYYFNQRHFTAQIVHTY